MGEDSPSNIFDFSAQSGKKKSKGPQRKKSRGGGTSSPEDVKRWLNEAESEREELEHLFSVAKGTYGDFNEKIEAMCKPSGMTKQDFKDYYEDPKNFSPKEWEDLQRYRKEMEDDIKTISKKAKIEGGAISSSKKGLAKNRKGKTLGARRRWMNMH